MKSNLLNKTTAWQSAIRQKEMRDSCSGETLPGRWRRSFAISKAVEPQICIDGVSIDAQKPNMREYYVRPSSATRHNHCVCPRRLLCVLCAAAAAAGPRWRPRRNFVNYSASSHKYDAAVQTSESETAPKLTSNSACVVHRTRTPFSHNNNYNYNNYFVYIVSALCTV